MQIKTIMIVYYTYPDKVLVEIPETGALQLVWFMRLFLSLPKPSIEIANSILFDYLALEGDVNIRFHNLILAEKFIHRQKIENDI